MAQTRRAKERALKNDRFIDVAQRLFLKQGYDQTSIQQVADAADFSKRAVYLYFANKHELFSAVLLRGLSTLHQKLRSSVMPSLDGRNQVISIARSYANYALDHAEFFELLMFFERRDYFYRKQTERAGHYAKQCLDINHAMGELLNDAIRRGALDGSVVSDLETHQFNLMLWAAVAGVVQVAVWRRQLLPKHYQLSALELIDAALERLLPVVKS